MSLTDQCRAKIMNDSNFLTVCPNSENMLTHKLRPRPFCTLCQVDHTHFHGGLIKQALTEDIIGGSHRGRVFMGPVE